MKTLSVLALTLALASSVAVAQPFLYADLSDQTVTHCGYAIDAVARVDVPVVVVATLKACKVSVGGVSVGSHTATLTAVKIDPVWGRQESAPSANFTFARPAPAPVPTGSRLAP